MIFKGLVYLVEDDDITREAISLLLELVNFQVRNFANSSLCMKAIHDKQPDFIVSDMEMRGGDGLSLLKNIQVSGLKLPIIIMTGNIEPELEMICIRMGAVAFLRKPFSSNRLISILEGLQPVTH